MTALSSFADTPMPGGAGPAELNDYTAANYLAAYQKALAGALIYSNVRIRKDLAGKSAEAVQAKIEHLDWAALRLQLEEDDLLRHLLAAPTPDQATAWLALDAELQQTLLSDEGAALPAPEATHTLARLVQAQQALLAADPTLHGRAALRWQLLHELECLGPQWAVATTPPPASQLGASLSRFKWKRYLASRRLRYLSELSAARIAGELELKADNFFNTLATGSDLQLGLPAHTFVGFETAPQALAPDDDVLVMAGSSAAEDDYQEAVRRLAETRSAKQHHASLVATNASGIARNADLKEYKKRYDELSRDEAAYAYLVQEKRKNRGGDFTNLYEDYLKGSTSQALKGGFQVLWSTVGQATKRAALDKLDGKEVDGDELARTIYKGLLVTGVTVAATLYLGPLGPIISGQMMGAFFPQPDPLQLGLDKLQKTLTTNFAKVDARFDQLKEQLAELEALVKAGTEETADYIDKRANLQDAKAKFGKALDEVRSRITLVETHYSDLLVDGRSGEAFVGSLLAADTEIRAGIVGLLRQFYHSNLAMDKLPEPGTFATADSLADRLMKFYSQKPPFFRPFHLVGAELQLYCAQLQLLVQQYFAARQKIELSLGAIAVFGDKLSQPRPHLLETLSELHESELEERSRYFVGVTGLEANVLGPNNLALLREMQRYWQQPTQFALSAGFGLGVAGGTPSPNPATGGQEWAVPAGKPSGPLWLVQGPWTGAPARYYVVPPGGTPPGVAALSEVPEYRQPYTLCTWQNGELPQWLQAYVALAPHDCLRLYAPLTKVENYRTLPEGTGFGREVLAQTLALAVAPAFAHTLERALLLPVPLPLPGPDGLRLHLPRRGCELLLKVITSSAGQQLSAQVLEHGKLVDTLPAATAPRPATGLHFGVGPAAVEVGLAPVLAGQPPLTNLLRRSWPADVPPQYYGLWSATMAFGPTDAPTGRPFRYLLYPHELAPLTGPLALPLHSPLGDYRVEARQHLGFDWVLELHQHLPGTAEPRSRDCGSLFGRYTYQQNDYQVRAVMQDDGNLVLYDSHHHAVAASNTSGRQDAVLHLTDEGRLLLRAQYKPTAPVLETLVMYELLFQREDLNWDKHTKFNRLLPQHTLPVAGRLTSVQNGFELLLESDARTERCGFLWLDQEIKHESKLIKRQHGQEKYTWRDEKTYQPSLKDWSWHSKGPTNVDIGVYSWLDPSDNLTIHTKLLLGRDQMPSGVRMVQTLFLYYCDHPSADAYLTLADNGDLELRAASSGDLLHKL